MLWLSYPCFNFFFPALFLGMVMYDNEFGTKETIKIKTKKKMNHYIYTRNA